jgi:SAM-dependent methyltransferase
MSDRSFEFFLQFHRNVPRQGPGTPEATAEAFRRVRPCLPPTPRVLDLGCGSGGQTIVIAGLTDGPIVAVDFHRPFIEELRQRAADAGLSGRILAEVGDMNVLDLGARRFDLVWCEGAIFIVGFARGLELIRPWLEPSGVVVLSEAVWLKPPEEAPPVVADCWKQAYPPMTTIEANLAMAESAGYAVIDHFTLPREGWDAYVDPVEARMNEVLASVGDDPDARAAAEAERKEFAAFRANDGWFGYEFFLLRRSHDALK